jgi:hypothetical protein
VTRGSCRFPSAASTWWSAGWRSTSCRTRPAPSPSSSGSSRLAGWWRHFWDAAVALDPAVADLDEARRFPLCRPEPLAGVWAGAGLGTVRVEAIEVPTVFADFDDFWTPFLGGQGPAPGYVMSLTDERRGALRDLLRSRLPAGPDGSIPLRARAWAVRGEV